MSTSATTRRFVRETLFFVSTTGITRRLWLLPGPPCPGEKNRGRRSVQYLRYRLSALSPDAGPSAFFWPLIFRGMGSECLLPPIMTLEMSTIPRNLKASGAARQQEGASRRRGRHCRDDDAHATLGPGPSVLSCRERKRCESGLPDNAGLSERCPASPRGQVGIVRTDRSRFLGSESVNQSLLLTVPDLYPIVGATTLLLLMFTYLFERSPLPIRRFEYPPASPRKTLPIA
jgi:DHA2 family multidrug resistance protein